MATSNPTISLNEEKLMNETVVVDDATDEPDKNQSAILNQTSTR
jgi:hypothetical protein